ncbi:hypothetical protein DX933_15130 [Ornithinibacillus gellani]|uniref:hypothetical protein n=1 Tax=Ornithinibacillus gellani TaxID=2293253 RepID=UPI000F489906|nr:hypothetical protein [Ornithinibacillus gellani]TQS71907.1 hypothetical protein DX933_15130 [Ornithinibacillus gellani]
MVKLDENIILTLEKMKVSIELIEPKVKEYLNKVEKTISEKFSLQEEIMTQMKKNRPSINNIATESKIARQTIYNNEVLKNYIEIRIDQYNQDDPVKRNEKLSEKISELESIIKKMMERDVSVELMRRKVSLVENELKLLKRENVELHERYNNLKHKKDVNENIKSNVVKLSPKH